MDKLVASTVHKQGHPHFIQILCTWKIYFMNDCCNNLSYDRSPLLKAIPSGFHNVMPISSALTVVEDKKNRFRYCCNWKLPITFAAARLTRGDSEQTNTTFGEITSLKRSLTSATSSCSFGYGGFRCRCGFIQWCSPRDQSLGLEAPRGQKIKSWSWSWDPESWSWSWSWSW